MQEELKEKLKTHREDSERVEHKDNKEDKEEEEVCIWNKQQSNKMIVFITYRVVKTDNTSAQKRKTQVTDCTSTTKRRKKITCNRHICTERPEIKIIRNKIARTRFTQKKNPNLYSNHPT